METYLGIKSEVRNFSLVDKIAIFSLIIYDNPLNDYVELPDNLKSLEYSNLICGVIRGCMSMVDFIIF